VRALTESEKAIEGSDLIIEAIIENLELKQDLFSFLDKKARWAPSAELSTHIQSRLHFRFQHIVPPCPGDHEHVLREEADASWRPSLL
jgi:3-hydroxyacyl-CoA dehydrogenase